MSDICAICYESLDGDDQLHKLTCDHNFHTKCIIQWFRTGHQSCPTCRDSNVEALQQLGSMPLYARASYIRRKARCKNCPPELLKMVEQIRAWEIRSRDAKKAYNEYRRNHKDILSKYNSLRTKMYNYERKTRDIITVLGLYQNDTLKLPPLQIYVYS